MVPKDREIREIRAGKSDVLAEEEKSGANRMRSPTEREAAETRMGEEWKVGSLKRRCAGVRRSGVEILSREMESRAAEEGR